ncbi:MAG: lipoic acid synthetase [Pseudohongiellaceae bacterium]
MEDLQAQSSLPAPSRGAKPSWLKIRPPGGEKYTALKAQLKERGLSTVCEEARCPNVEECWGGGTATLMLMGDTCTRACSFCAVKTARLGVPLDPAEPARSAESVELMDLDYVVLTSVDRDDLPDGGAAHFGTCVQAIRERNPQTLVEVLIPDFSGNAESLAVLLESQPDVVAQNLETVERLTRPVRDPRAGYEQTLSLLARVKEIDPTRLTKSSIMLGLGEEPDEVRTAMKALRAAGVDFLTLGQYLAPSKKHHPVVRYVTPEEFDAWRVEGEALGFRYVASGPLVRSSYRAGEFAIKAVFEERQASSNEISRRTR